MKSLSLTSRSLFVLLLFVNVLAVQPELSADDWPAFRGPGGDGIVQTKADLPTEWSADSNVAWMTEIPGNGWSSPVVVGNRIYVTAAIPDETNASATKEAADDGKKEAKPDYSLSLLILDATTGSLLHRIGVMEQDGARSPRVHSKNSHASPTPIVQGDRIYVHFGYQGTACLNLAGEILWTNRDLYFKPTHGNGGTPILVGNHLIFTCDGDKEPKVVALNADTGDIAWQTRRPLETKKTFSFCTPTAIRVDGMTQVIAPGSDNVLALDPMTGDIIWDVRYVGYSVVPKPVYHNGLVYVATSFDSSKLLAIEPTGRGVVTDTHVKWRLEKNMPKTPSLIAHEGLIYSISDDGIASCVEADSGETVYRKRVGGKYSASPLLAGKLLYLTSEGGVTTVVETGRQFKKVAENDIGRRTLASMAVAGDSLIMRTEGAIFRIENL